MFFIQDTKVNHQGMLHFASTYVADVFYEQRRIVQ